MLSFFLLVVFLGHREPQRDLVILNVTGGGYHGPPCQ